MSKMMILHKRKFFLVIILLALSVSSCFGDYQGASLGKLSSYSNQVSGDVFVIDDQTFLIKNFFYDGLAQDAFFWAGSSIRPSNKGFIVPSEDGRTNRLQRYTNRDITIQLPDERRISAIRWLSIWDVRSSKNLGDIIIPDEFEPPSPKKISEFSSYARGVKSDTVTLLDARSIRIEQLYYDGSSQSAFFLAGIGTQPSASGTRLPDETGALEPLGAYTGEDIILQLPGNLTIFDIDWLALYDVDENETLGSLLIPSHLSVPPALVTIIKYESRLRQCEQLHRDIQLNWDVFGPQITFELVARIAPNDYIGFGISGTENASSMVGADVSISYLDAHLGYTTDYNITDKHPCVALQNNKYHGVCPDTKLAGGVDNYQIHTFSRENGLTKITFRRNLLNTGDDGDKVFKTSGPTSIVWAVGRLNKFKEPRYHHMYSKGKVSIEFGRKLSKNCFQFTMHAFDSNANANDAAFSRQQVAAISHPRVAHHQQSAVSPLNFLSRLSSGSNAAKSALSTSSSSSSSTDSTQVLNEHDSWGQPVVLNRTATVFYARVGHPGVQKGYMRMTNEGSPGLVWYINGLMAPILHVQRGKQYTFRVEGGDSLDKSYRFYHPFYITDEPYGGYVHQNLTEKTQQKVFAGLQFEKAPNQQQSASGQQQNKHNGKPQLAHQIKMIGKPAPTSVGRLCAWLPNDINDLRKAEAHQSFAQFRAKLNYNCLPGQPGIVQWTPNVSTPDVVYYQSYSQRNMGWKIIVHDDTDPYAEE